MKRNLLLRQLASYRAYNAHEAEMLRRLTLFVLEEADCFERTLRVGHVTGSAWIIDPAQDYVLLTHHEKLDKWLQLGGHADGEPDVLQVALREAREESGIENIRPVSSEIFDVDVHKIPKRGNEPAHLHYDVRFLLAADRDCPLRITPESRALAWIPLDKVAALTREESVARMVAKTPRKRR